MSVPKGAEAWFARAEGELLSIQNNLNGAQTPWELVLFSAHQAIEKYLKGLLVKHGAPVPKTHDLSVLVRECSPFVPELRGLEAECGTVSALYLSSRYPETVEPTEQQSRDALALALKVKSAILGESP